ncbi:protein kinase domain-containing protein [Endozoicomonas sp. ALC013]|uniref:protein kinase domain-containing protein n=1 Tax=Endozoicomonas sp. ALC013 TaxID=3403076 RepID=UPI003BB70A14
MHYPPSIATKPPLHQMDSVRGKQRNAPEIKFIRQLSPREARMAEELYGQLKAHHHSSSDRSCHCLVKSGYFDRLVGFKRAGEKPFIIQVHDITNPYIGKGAFGEVYESSLLVRKSEKCWGVPQGQQYNRIMKIQKNTEVARSEMDFHSVQPGSLGAGKFNGDQYLDQLRIPGECLQKYFEDKKWPLKDRFDCAVAMLICAKTFVAGGLVHPDLKPSNMMYDVVNKEIFFIDNAHVFDLENPSAPKPQNLVGTPLFIEPDQYRKSEITDKSMVFSLGIILLNLFSDKPDRYKVAESRVSQGKDLKLNLAEFLPKLRIDSNDFVKQLSGFLTQMVSTSSASRPDLDECLGKMTAFSSGYKIIEEAASELKLAKSSVENLKYELTMLKQSQRLAKRSGITEEEFKQLKEEGAAKEYKMNMKLQVQQIAIEKMEEEQKQKLEKLMQVQQLKLEKQKQETESLEKQTAYYKAAAERAQSDVEQTSRILAAQRAEVEEMEGALFSQEKELRRLTEKVAKAEEQNREADTAHNEAVAARIEAEQALTEAQNRNSQYEQKLTIAKNDQKRATSKLEEFEVNEKKLLAEKASEETKVKELSSKLSKNLKAPLDRLKKVASNRDDIDKADFCRILPGIIEALPSKSEQIRLLEEIGVFILWNIGATYTHKSNLRPFSLLYPRRQSDFTKTQRMHLEAVSSQAKALAEKMLKGNEESKRLACNFLSKGFVTRVQVTDALTADSGWAESLLASTTGISKYQFTSEDVAKFKKSHLCHYFQDGREGDPGKSKQLAAYMADLENVDEVSAARSLLAMLAAKEPVENFTALENEFLSILTRPDAYTRGAQDTVTWFAEYVCESVVGEKLIRQDIDSPSATKMKHIALLRSSYAEVLKPLIGQKLDSLTVQKLAESRLVNFSPVQYQHELQGFQNDLKYKVTALLESEENIAVYKDYLHKKFAADFSVS